MHEFEAILVVIAVILLAVFCGGMWYGKTTVRGEAVTKGYALYCPNSGDFAWMNECGSVKND